MHSSDMKRKDNESDNKLSETQKNERHSEWLSVTSKLYNILIEEAFLWPSLSIRSFKGEDSSEYLLYGTNASKDEQNYIFVSNGSASSPEKGFLTVVKKIPHEGCVNRVKENPSRTSIICSQSGNGNIYLFDTTKKVDRPLFDTFEPDITLKGHTEEGYGISFSPHTPNILATSSYDGTICIWDIDENNKERDKPLSKLMFLAPGYLEQGAPVEDVQFNPHKEKILGSVDDSGRFLIWDTRCSYSVPHQIICSHIGSATNCFAFHPSNENVSATAGSNGLVVIFDHRNTLKPLYTIQAHDSDITQLQWSPFSETMLATSSLDNNVNVFDLDLATSENELTDSEKPSSFVVFSPFLFNCYFLSFLIKAIVHL